MAKLVTVILWYNQIEVSLTKMPSEMELQQHYMLLWEKGQPKVTSFYLGDFENGLLHIVLGYGISLLSKSLLWHCNLLLEMRLSSLNEYEMETKPQNSKSLVTQQQDELFETF